MLSALLLRFVFCVPFSCGCSVGLSTGVSVCVCLVPTDYGNAICADDRFAFGCTNLRYHCLWYLVETTVDSRGCGGFMACVVWRGTITGKVLAGHATPLLARVNTEDASQATFWYSLADYHAVGV